MALIRTLGLLLICVLVAINALAQPEAFGPETLNTPEPFLTERQTLLDETRAEFEADHSGDLTEIRTKLSESREILSRFIEALEGDIAARDLRIADLAPLEGEDTASETSAPVTGSDVLEAVRAGLEQSRTALETTERLRRDYDALLAQVAEQATRNDLQRVVDERRAEIEAASRRLDLTDDEQELLEIRGALRAMRTVAASDVDPLRETRDRLEADLERLGDLPAEGTLAEAPEITEEREKLTRALVDEDAIIRQSALNIADINRLLEDITKRRRDQFYSRLLTRGTFPLSPDLIGIAGQNAASSFGALVAKGANWQTAHAARGDLAFAYSSIAISLFVAFFIFFPTRRWVNRRLLSQLQSLEPTPGRRAWVALLRMITRIVPGIIGGLIVMEAFRFHGVIDETTSSFARVIWFAALGLITAEAGTTAILSPGVPGWRLMPIEKLGADWVKYLFLALVFVFFFDRILSVGATMFGGNQELALLQSAVIASLLGALYIILTRSRWWRLEDHRKASVSEDVKKMGTRLRQTGTIVGGLIILGSIIGYVSVSYYVATRIFMIGGLIILGLFIRLIAHEALRTADNSFKRRAARREEATGERLVLFWLGVLVDTIIFIAFAPVAAMALGAEWVDVRDRITGAFFGFKIGSFTLSIAQILGGLLTFLIILGITRFFQTTAEKRLFPRTRLDIGVQNSLKTMIGYVGLVIAVMSAISVLGVNLASLAIIAGALSLGIGFGLQSIVNNFVSGLILLFERPIKVGDWIVVGSGEGMVKKISVRSTEIETFDRASIIVPNSELISSSVTNWTHKDRWTRVIVPVGVSYDAKPRRVMELLESVIEGNRKVLAFPEPSIFFVGFGDNSLDFELRVFLANTADRIPVQNEIRLAVFDALEEAGIEIPFPQRDLHIKSLPANRADAADVDEEEATDSLGKPIPNPHE